MNPQKLREPEELVGRSERISQLGAEAVETAAGAAAGAAFGVLAGPVGVAAGSVFGAIVAAVLGHEAHGQEHETTTHFEALEDEAESIRQWRGSHPPPPPQAPEAPAEDDGSIRLEELDASLGA